LKFLEIMAEGEAMAESHEAPEHADPVAAFDSRIEKLHHEGVYSHELGKEIPWAEATELNKVGALTGAALSVSLKGPAVPGERGRGR
jgi:hypothetical protein